MAVTEVIHFIENNRHIPHRIAVYEHVTHCHYQNRFDLPRVHAVTKRQVPSTYEGSRWSGQCEVVPLSGFDVTFVTFGFAQRFWKEMPTVKSCAVI